MPVPPEPLLLRLPALPACCPTPLEPPAPELEPPALAPLVPVLPDTLPRGGFWF
jgi:hypothetical protein